MPGIKPPSQVRLERAADQQRAEARAKIEDDDFVWLMRSERGRRIVARLLKTGRSRGKNFDTHSLTMARHVGVSDFVQLELLDRIFKLCPEHYAALMRENT